MSHLFTKLNGPEDFDKVAGPATIVRNVTPFTVYVDKDLRGIGSGSYAAIDKSCEMCAKAIEKGKLIIVKEVSGAQKVKSKSKFTAEPAPEPVVESAPKTQQEQEIIQEIKPEIPVESEPSNPQDSVQ